MILSPYERELIARSVAAERHREAREIRGLKHAIHQVPPSARPPVARVLRQAVGLLLIRAGARVAGISPRLVAECK